MSSDLDLMTGGSSGGGRRRAEKPTGKSPVGKIVALVIVVALVLGGFWAYGKVKNQLDGTPDYTGQGSGEVVVEIAAGATGQQIANALAEQDVVKSASAFYQLSLNDARAQAIQPGFYKLRKQMSAKWALDELSDKANRVESKVTIPEGSRVGEIVAAIAENTDITEDALLAALDKPESLGLPDVANLNPEGYLYPATYTVEPGTTAEQLLQQMVAKTLQVAKDLDIGTRARALGLTGEEVLTVASILEFEGKRDEDFPKIARVLYNRLDDGMPLQLDSTVSYVSKREGDVWTTPEERAAPSEYNTYQNQGLPPGPIGSPGAKTIEAALNPEKGDWLYFVPDFEKGTTVFTDNLADHEAAAERAREYCRTHEEC